MSKLWISLRHWFQRDSDNCNRKWLPVTHSQWAIFYTWQIGTRHSTFGPQWERIFKIGTNLKSQTHLKGFPYDGPCQHPRGKSWWLPWSLSSASSEVYLLPAVLKPLSSTAFMSKCVDRQAHTHSPIYFPTPKIFFTSSTSIPCFLKENVILAKTWSLVSKLVHKGKGFEADLDAKNILVKA